MQACDRCHLLVGEPSSVPPHADLAASGVARLANRCKTDSRWRCMACGAWMYQGTALGEPPNMWRMGPRPQDMVDVKV
ncbi:MAG: hypothetical protein JO067_00355 [Cupriavidus sp.]|nr:hypothetical protein [Cupriavidus sp.]